MTIDNVVPEEKWKFNEDVTEVFDDMLKRSIPQYDIMRESVTALALPFVRKNPNYTIVDLGCSRGEAIASLVDTVGVGARYILCDVSEPMLQVCEERFSRWIEDGFMRVLNLDLRTDYPACNSSVTMAILTIQFTPIEHRHKIIQNIYDNLVEDGAFIMVEKVLGSQAVLNEIMVETYYDLKKRNKYTQEQIDRKRLSLEGVLVPVTANWNIELMKSAGFKVVDCFWRWMNFAGWIAIK